MAVRLPGAPKAEKSQPLLRCLKYAAQQMGTNEYFVANMMSHFLAKVADEVADGNMVYLTGFGAIGPGAAKQWWMSESRRFCIPKFIGSRSFREQMKSDCPFDKNQKDALTRFARGTSPSPAHKGERVFNSMRRSVQAVRSQAKKLDFNAGPPPHDPGAIRETLP